MTYSDVQCDRLYSDVKCDKLCNDSEPLLSLPPAWSESMLPSGDGSLRSAVHKQYDLMIAHLICMSHTIVCCSSLEFDWSEALQLLGLGRIQAVHDIYIESVLGMG